MNLKKIREKGKTRQKVTGRSKSIGDDPDAFLPSYKLPRLKLPDAKHDIELDDAAEIEWATNLLADIERAHEDETEGGYSFTIVFPCARTCDEFLANSGWVEFTDSSMHFMDGIALADHLGIDLTKIPVRFKDGGTDTRLVNEVGIIGDDK